MENINSYKIKLNDFLFFCFLLFTMGAKAVGMSEGQKPFTALLIMSVAIFLYKLFITEYCLFEWAINILLIILGILIYVNSRHVEALFGIFIIIGMKGVQIKRAVKFALFIWMPFFVLTIIRALIGIYPGFIGYQKKIGINDVILRYSLGYTHPNVLHITFLILTLMIMYLININSIRQVYTSIVIIFFANIYIFSYSVSYTGFFTVLICLFIFLTLSFQRKRLKLLYAIILLLIIGCTLFLVLSVILLPDNVRYFFDGIFNNRFAMVKNIFTNHSPGLFGNSIPVNSIEGTLDSSFPYMLMWHGILAFILYVLSLIATMIYQMRNNSKGGIIVLLGCSLAGSVEQFLANLSFKNITYLFIGDYIYNVLFDKIKYEYGLKSYKLIQIRERNIDLEFMHILKKRLFRFIHGTPWLKCFMPAIVIAICLCAIVDKNYVVPNRFIFKINNDASNDGTVYVFNPEEYNDTRTLILGNPQCGDNIKEITYINGSYERIRAIESALVWGIIGGITISIFILNKNKLKKVCIESPTGEIAQIQTCNILGVNVAVTNMFQIVDYLKERLEYLRGKYICISNVHTTEMSKNDNEYLRIQNEAEIVCPDGMPLSYVERMRGYMQAERVAGPDLMEEIFKISEKNHFKHYFFGATEDTLEKLRDELKRKYPNIEIVGMTSPKYFKNIGDISEDEDNKYVKGINAANPDFVWVGLGAPKQEIWMNAHKDRINGVMIGVGAGFDFHAGTVKRAPKWLQALYLEWFYRLIQDPKRLIKRYFSTNFKFIKDVIKENRALKHNHRNDSESTKKRVLIYAHYYAPDVASTGQILTELAEGMSNTYEVSVVCVVPSYKGIIEDYYLKYRYYYQKMNGVNVFRVRVPEYSKTNKLSRVYNIFKYFTAARKVTRLIGQQDYVFTISQPPILGGILGKYGKKYNRAKLIYNIQDFNPEQSESTGYVRSRLVNSIMRYIDNKSISFSDMVVLVGSDMVDTLKKRFVGKTVPDYVVINNWINEKNVYPLNANDERVNQFKERYGLADKFVFMYSGNIGLYYDLENIIKVIRNISSDAKSLDGREVVFAFVGDGSKKRELETYVVDNKMDNVVFIPYQDKEDILYSLNAADVHLCVNAKGIKGISCPSKYYGIAAVAKPVLAVLEDGSEIRNIIEAIDGGFIVNPSDYEKMSEMIEHIISDCTNETLHDIGMRNYDRLIERYTKDKSVEKYIEVFENM